MKPGTPPLGRVNFQTEFNNYGFNLAFTIELYKKIKS
jgi:hypothetical protein